MAAPGATGPRDLGWLVARPIAHRGLHDKAKGVIENSLTAAGAAIAGGFGIECDVQLSADGVPMVFHDFTLDRLTGSSGQVSARTAAELGAMTLAGSPQDRIPTLEALLDLVDGRVPLVIEIKSRFDGALDLTRATAAVLGRRKDRQVVLKSFDPAIVTALRELSPGVPRGIVAKRDNSGGETAHLTPEQQHALSDLLHFGESRPDFLSWRVGDLPSAAPYLCRVGLGLPVMSWTARTPQDRERAASHADQIVFEGFTP